MCKNLPNMINLFKKTSSNGDDENKAISDSDGSSEELQFSEENQDYDGSNSKSKMHKNKRDGPRFLTGTISQHMFKGENSLHKG